MRKILVLPIFALLAFVISFSAPEVYATPSITLSSGSVCCTVTILGSGFIAEENLTVYVFVDSTLSDSVSVNNIGSFSITIPVAPGTHTITISGDPNNPIITQLASGTITVSSASIPEFPFSFSLVIIFVAVTAVYLAIRQKMSANFKPF